MPRWQRIHPEFEIALHLLARSRVSYAEAWRLLIPVSERVDEPRPSYYHVREILIDERIRLSATDEARNRVIHDVVTGWVPRL
jgi:hypothetical protein